ncbi:hypothetical protein J2Z82_001745 [Virgibacillus litoralis]|uniref:Uncharacterized protein n=1 Tax=Virgibacillus litoralis TaxID=578221 RepID=A0ABS4HD61_9BACI|nr:hypothetical protein [Virgibacillus litoralis]
MKKLPATAGSFFVEIVGESHAIGGRPRAIVFDKYREV